MFQLPCQTRDLYAPASITLSLVICLIFPDIFLDSLNIKEKIHHETVWHCPKCYAFELIVPG